MRQVAVTFIVLAIAACSDGPSKSNNPTNVRNVSTTNNTVTNGPYDCLDAMVRFQEADYIEPTCEVDDDCEVYGTSCCGDARAAGDRSEAEAIRAEAEAEGCDFRIGPICENNWVCPSGQFRASCAGGQCRMVPTMSCETAEPLRHGGLARAVVVGLYDFGGREANCGSDAVCAIRNDLNPCGCDEPVHDDFEDRDIEAIRQVLDDVAACDFECACPTAGTAAVCTAPGSCVFSDM